MSGGDYAACERKYEKKRQYYQSRYDEAMEEQGGEQLHVSSVCKIYGRLHRDTICKNNGTFFIRKNKSRKSHYNDLSLLKERIDIINTYKFLTFLKKKLTDALDSAKKGNNKVKIAAKLASEVKKIDDFMLQPEWFTYDYERSEAGVAAGNNKNFFRSPVPYSFDVHYLLPYNSFLMLDEDKKALLLRLPYDVNHGENMILLPRNLVGRYIHGFPLHRGRHPNYDARVNSDIKELDSCLSDKAEGCDKSTFSPKKLLKKLVTLQNDYYKYFVQEARNFDIIEAELNFLVNKVKEKIYNENVDV
ncbi:hypothetical protein CHISP_2960 [Chitinispirillum alkaliphilum]|nr:hypothetical protein CHISP_2960 [Chitinispirillum alkaliphilum]